jgi:hypothetical protein
VKNLTDLFIGFTARLTKPLLTSILLNIARVGKTSITVRFCVNKFNDA